MRRVLIALLSLVATTAISSDTREIANLLGVVPGQPSSVRSMSSGAPFEILRLPTPSPQLAKIYADLEFMVLKSSGRVVGVGSLRAYPSKAACEEASTAVRKLLVPVFPGAYTGRDPRWQFQSADGGTTAGTFCEDAAAYPVLRLDVTHTKTNEALLTHFKQSPANSTVERDARKNGARPSP